MNVIDFFGLCKLYYYVIKFRVWTLKDVSDRKGQVSNMGTVWLIILIGFLLIAFILAVPPYYRDWLLGD